MKRVLLLLLTIVTATIAMGQEVTPDQALEKAKKFMESHETTVKKQKRAAGKTSSLKMTSRVNDLYIFNVDNDGGFVVVSNSERTVPILGFSETGSFDPDNIPDNMKAWLQGYADQIAWQEKQGTGVTVSNAPKRNATHSTNEIQPLIETKWNQGAPYNNKCPLYQTGYRSVTGCVATAMAQVMNYHRWPTDPTAEIPEYITDSWGLNLDALSATTFDWDNMSNTYTNSTTGATAEAVATLMQYCGWAVKMDYGESSGASSSMIAEALIKYFDYNNETTQFVSRSFYTADKWADLIYHELANKRPVLYGGMSSGGGHEFVCDGYRYEDGTDFFHINWGWGGESDQYFVLSALDPEQQGIGGSSSDDGFHYGQDAIIGIQSSEKNGEVASITPNVINLKVNSMTPSSNTSICYMPVNVTVNVTNRSSEDYDGDIYLGRRYNDNYYFLEGSNYFIPAGETKDVVIPFIPTETGTYDIIYWLPSEGGYYTTNTQIYTSIEVTDATSNGFVPVYGYYCNQLSRSQFIIPKGNIEDLYNSTINGMTFYASTTSAIRWGNAQFDVYLKEVDETTFADNTLKDWTTLDKVYSGSLSVSDNGKMEITFDTPYQYNGGNLLVGINQTVSGSYATCYWVGFDVEGVSLSGNEDNIAQRNFLPYTTFDYTAEEQPEDIILSNASDNSEVLTTYNGKAVNVTLQDRYLYRDGAWNTLCLPFNAEKTGDFTDATIMELDVDGMHDDGKQTGFDTSDGTLYVFFKEADRFTAGKPCLVKWNTTGEPIENPTFTGVTITSTEPETVEANNSGLNAVQFIGTYAPAALEANTSANLYLDANDELCYPTVADFQVNAFRAYFTVDLDGQNSVNHFSLRFGEKNSTPVIALKADAKNKYSDEWYMIDGRKLNGKPTVKGLYIHAGRKVVIK